MAKGYWIARIDVSDPEGYKAYIAANAEAFRKFGAHFLVRGGKFEPVEGTSRERNVVIEFKDYATALACYRSPEYAKAHQAARRQFHRRHHRHRRLRRPAASVDRLETRSMSDMRLIVAGAGGRMGRTLIHAIAATDGVALAGAVEWPGSAVIGRDAGELAGLGANGVMVAAEVEPLLGKADGLLDFTIPAATIAFAELVARKGLRACHRHDRPVGRERQADRGSGQARRHRQVRQYEHGGQSARRSGQAGGEDARCGFRYRNPRNASQQENRCALRHGADARPRGGRGPRHRARAAFGSAAATARPARGGAATSALPRCAAGPLPAITR